MLTTGNALDGAPFIGNGIDAPGLPALLVPPPEQAKHVVPDRYVAGFPPVLLCAFGVLITPVPMSTSDQRSRRSSLGSIRASVVMPSMMTRWICGAAAPYSRRAPLTDDGAIRWASGLAIRGDTSRLESSRHAHTVQPYAARRMFTRRCTVDRSTSRWRYTSYQTSTSS